MQTSLRGQVKTRDEAAVLAAKRTSSYREGENGSLVRTHPSSRKVQLCRATRQAPYNLRDIFASSESSV